MKRSTFSSVLLLLCFFLLGFVAVKIARLDSRVKDLARPSRLFNPQLIESKFAFRKDWEVNISKDHDAFFFVMSQQTLNWLGRGAQVVAFETQDNRYVVKFFQVLGRLEEPEKGFFRKLFTKDSEKERQERVNRREELFSSSKMCFEELQEETGIVYVHLNRTIDKIHGLKLVDRFGQSHRIRGDNACFIVQKKVAYLIPTFMSLMEKGDVAVAHERIDQIFSLLLSLAQKGFADGDDALIRNNNLGFTKDRAIYIDTGHIFRTKNLNVLERMQYEFSVRLDPLEHWLNVMYPELGEYYHQRKEAVLAECGKK